MREIEFRAWDKDESKMLSPRTLGTLDIYMNPFTGGMVNTNSRFPDGSISGWDSMRYIPMQFTGLLDKNGTKIFEGDIVVASWIGGGGFGAVEWSENNCLFGIHIGDVYEGLNGLTGIEVIGNIYENPELLK